METNFSLSIQKRCFPTFMKFFIEETEWSILFLLKFWKTFSSHAFPKSAFLNLINQSYTPPFCSFIKINSFVGCKISLINIQEFL